MKNWNQRILYTVYCFSNMPHYITIVGFNLTAINNIEVEGAEATATFPAELKINMYM